MISDDILILLFLLWLLAVATAMVLIGLCAAVSVGKLRRNNNNTKVNN